MYTIMEFCSVAIWSTGRAISKLLQGTDLQGGPDRLQLLGDIIRKQAGNADHRRTEHMAEGRERVLSGIL